MSSSVPGSRPVISFSPGEILVTVRDAPVNRRSSFQNLAQVGHRRTAGCSCGIADYLTDLHAKNCMLASLYRVPTLHGSRLTFRRWGADQYDVYRRSLPHIRNSFAVSWICIGVSSVVC
ncbi:hypothetical protein HAX54_030494 [Datura stramonium]|uniref:Uncharacterized protein n=1 Tax=Datura stramonium TaxID=4076 RepID=A0ABS8V926_DATST|nr:hypothetical protein [Datura stramonium]